MKKELRAQLVSIAHSILKMDQDPDYATMQAETKKLYDTLAVLAFAEKHFDGIQPTIGKQEIIEALQEKTVTEVEEIIQQVEIKQPEQQTAPPVEQPKQEEKPATLEQPEIEVEPEEQITFTEQEEEPTLRVETDTERVARIAKENQERFEANKRRKEEEERKIRERHEQKKNDLFLFEPVIEEKQDPQDAFEQTYEEAISPKGPMKNDMGEIGEYGKMADFEEKETITEVKPKSLNDKLNRGLTFGLNDRLAFIKHLFDGSTSDYNRVLGQINTMGSKEEALAFIQNMVKPDYNNWDGKEIYETRFMDAVERKFDS